MTKVKMLVFLKITAGKSCGTYLSHVSRNALVMEMFNNIRVKTVCKEEQEGHAMAQ